MPVNLSQGLPAQGSRQQSQSLEPNVTQSSTNQTSVINHISLSSAQSNTARIDVLSHLCTQDMQCAASSDFLKTIKAHPDVTTAQKLIKSNSKAIDSWTKGTFHGQSDPDISFRSKPRRTEFAESLKQMANPSIKRRLLNHHQLTKLSALQTIGEHISERTLSGMLYDVAEHLEPLDRKGNHKTLTSFANQMSLAAGVYRSANQSKNDTKPFMTLLLAAVKGDMKQAIALSNEILRGAVDKGHTNVIDTLSKAGINIDVIDTQGKTLIHRACDIGRTNLIDVLASHGVDVNAQDSQGNTALHYAVAHGHRDLVCQLLKSGADIEIPDASDRSCSQIAQDNNRNENITQLISHKQWENFNTRIQFNS